jgi:hypothetical protein
MRKPKSDSKLRLSPKGVFLVSPSGKKKVAAPISYDGVGTRIADNTRVAEISFMTFDGERLSETFNLAEFLRGNRTRTSVVERLANKGYRWPDEPRLIQAILTALTANIPDRRFKIVGAPGWHDEAYVTPDREYAAKKSTRRAFLIDHETGAKVAHFELGAGSLRGWKNRVAKVARKSSPLRLCISAGFAAPLLRPLGMDSFGLNLFGETSTGKTSCIAAGASVPGLFSDEGLPGWADSPAGIEQLIVGHRDTILPLDETGDGEDNKMKLAMKARLLAFAVGRNRPRNLDKGHEKASKLSTRDCRGIVLSSSERALGSVAMTEGNPRLGGEEVRFIDVPATNPSSQGVFDTPLRIKNGQSPLEVGKQAIDQLKRAAIHHQGHALHKFLRRYVKDPGAALDKVTQYMKAFEQKSSAVMITNADSRIRSKLCGDICRRRLGN